MGFISFSLRVFQQTPIQLASTLRGIDARPPMQETGRDLAERGAPLARVLASIQQLFGICLVHLDDPARENSSALALARLGSLASTLIASGYDYHWDTSRKSLQASLAKAG